MLTYTPRDLSSVFRSLDRLVADVQEAPAKALEWYGDTATKRMKANHDRSAHAIQRYVNRTWYLTTTIAFDVTRISGGQSRLRMFAPPTYAEAVEFGTPRSAPYPFFWIEVYGVQPAAEAMLSGIYFGALAAHEGRMRQGDRAQ